MVRYPKGQRLSIVKQYFKNDKDLADTIPNFRSKHGGNRVIWIYSLWKNYSKNLGKLDQLLNLVILVVLQQIVQLKIPEAVRQNVAKSLGASIRHRGQKLNKALRWRHYGKTTYSCSFFGQNHYQWWHKNCRISTYWLGNCPQYHKTIYKMNFRTQLLRKLSLQNMV